MQNIVYRNLEKKDYNRIKELINNAFGFSEFIKDSKSLDALLNIYLQVCILDSSFSKVAIKDNIIIGIILGNANNDKKYLNKFPNILSLIYNCIKVVFSSKSNKNTIKEFSKVSRAYKEIINGKENNFQGCIQLFIVSEESRGLGVGKTLLSYIYDYMRSMKVNNMYLYTDNSCNYGFYDSQNFKRLGEKEINFNKIEYNLNIFLYAYYF